MADKSVAYRLLSLFTSPDRAESIEGDLIEERHTNGHVWFAVNVVTTTFALWKQAVEIEFLRTLALSAFAVVLSILVCSALGLVYVELGVVSPVVMLLLIATFAFVLGAGLVRVAPGIGVTAATATSFVLLLLFLYTQIDSQVAGLRLSAEGNTVVATISAVTLSIRNLVGAALLYLLPLNLGSVLMHGRSAGR